MVEWSGQFTVVDIGAMVLIFLFILRGFFKGALYELLALFVWLIAFTLAAFFAKSLAEIFTPYISQESVRIYLALVGIFVASAVACTVVRFIIALILQLMPASGFSRLVGSVVGGLKGILLLGMLAWLLSFTQLGQAHWLASSVALQNARWLITKIWPMDYSSVEKGLQEVKTGGIAEDASRAIEQKISNQKSVETAQAASAK